MFNVKDLDLGWYTCLASVIGFGEIQQEVALFKKGKIITMVLSDRSKICELTQLAAKQLSSQPSSLKTMFVCRSPSHQ